MSLALGTDLRSPFPATLPPIEMTEAFNNHFFALCAQGERARNIPSLLHNWFAVTQSFCLSLIQYVGVLARARQSCEAIHRHRIEDALSIAIEIGAGEFAFGAEGRRAFHYNMFTRLGEPFGLESDDLCTHPKGITAETRALVDWLSAALADIHEGAGVVRVVESTAYQIVQAMDRLFRRQISQGELLEWSEEQREYISIHLELEPQHAIAVESLVEALSWSPEARATIDAATVNTAELFGRFWGRMSNEVFAKSHERNCA